MCLSCIRNSEHSKHTYLGTENPREVQQHESHGEKLRVWCAIHSQSVLDSYYFDNETVRKEYFCALLDSFVRAEAENYPDNALFQTNGAPPHISHAARSLLAHIFGQNWIGKYCSMNWPARSPDLTPLDFFL